MTSVGTDIVSVARFARWENYSDHVLLKIFHSTEVQQYRELLAIDGMRAIKFLASRFAVKEAFFKAVSDLSGRTYCVSSKPFLELARNVYLEKTSSGVPFFTSEVLEQLLPGFLVEASVSLAHEQCCVVAVVLLKVCL